MKLSEILDVIAATEVVCNVQIRPGLMATVSAGVYEMQKLERIAAEFGEQEIYEISVSDDGALNLSTVRRTSNPLTEDDAP